MNTAAIPGTNALFFALLVGALVGVGAASASGSAWWTLGAAVGPLIVYAVILLGSVFRGTRLNAAAIDSVYYFGFLVTLAALAGAVGRLLYQGGVGSDPELTNRLVRDVALTFVSGLSATVIALFVRIVLIAQTTALGDEDFGGQLLRVQDQVSRTVAVLARSTLEFENFSATLSDRTRSGTETALITFETEVAKGGQRAATSYLDASAAMRGAVEAFGDSLRAALPTDSVEELRATVKTASGTLGGLQGNINRLSEKTDQLHGVLDRLATVLAATADASEATAEAVGKLKFSTEGADGAGQALARLRDQSVLTSDATVELGRMVRETAQVFSTAASSVSASVMQQTAAVESYSKALRSGDNAARNHDEWREAQRDEAAKQLNELRESINSLMEVIRQLPVANARGDVSRMEYPVSGELDVFLRSLRAAREELDALTSRLRQEGNDPALRGPRGADTLLRSELQGVNNRLERIAELIARPGYFPGSQQGHTKRSNWLSGLLGRR